MADEQGQGIVVTLGADVSSFTKAMNNIQDKMDDTAKEIKGAMGDAEDSAKSGSKGIKNALKGIAGVVATAFAIDKIIDFGKTMVETTAEIDALESQYSQVMGDMEDDTTKYLGKMGKEWNKHPNELKSAYTQYVAILKSKGLAEEEAHETAKNYLERTVDANAFANESMEETTGRFMAGIKGEYDSLDTAMVNLSATMLDTKAQEEYGKSFADLTTFQQETLKAQEALRQHTDAGVVGQGVREADNYANNLAMVKNNWNELMASFGDPVLEFVNDQLSRLNDLLESINADGLSATFKDFGKNLKETVVDEFNEIDFGGMVDSMTNGIKEFSVEFAGKLSKDLQDALKKGDWEEVGIILSDIVVESIDVIAKRAGEFAGKIGEVILAIFKSIDWVTLGKNTVFFALGFVLGLIDGLFDPALWLDFIKDHWAVLLSAILGFIFAPAKILGKVGKALAKIPLVGKFLSWIWKGFEKLIKPLSEKFDDFFKNLGKNFTNGWKRMFSEKTVLGNWLDKLKNVWKRIREWFGEKLGSMNTRIQDWADKAGENLAKPFRWMLDKAGSLLEKVTGKIKDMKDNVLGIIDKIKEAFEKLKIKIPTPKIPKLKRTGTKTLFGGEGGIPSIKVPTFSWHKAGAIVRGTQQGTVVGVGEDHGDEAIVPLSNKSRMKPFAKAVADMLPNNQQSISVGGEYTFTIPVFLDGKEIAKGTARYTREELEKIDKRNNRMGGII